MAKKKKADAIRDNVEELEPVFRKKMKTHPYVWGIDSSISRLGFSIIELRTGKSKIIGDSEGTPGMPRLERSVCVAEYLCPYLETHPPCLIAMEDYAYRGASALKIAEFNGYWMTMVFFDPRILRLAVSPPSLKKFITGKGTKVEKDLMSTLVLRDYDVFCRNSDQADAFGLAQIGRSFIAKIIDAPLWNKLKPYQKEVVDTLAEKRPLKELMSWTEE